MEGFLIFISMIFLILIKVPVAFSMAVAAAIVLWLRDVSFALIPQRMFMAVNSFPLLAVPLFILVGQIMNTGGVSRKIFDFCRVWLRHMKGSLGHVNVAASVIFAGMSGSAVADASGLGIIEIEAMKKEGYDAAFSAAITAASSTIGPIIPPSIPMVVYAVLAEQSVGRLFLGGVAPGILMAVALMLQVYIVSKRNKYKTESKATWGERLQTSFSAIPSLLTPIILLSGVLLGIVTPSEAGIIAIIYAIFLGFFINKELAIHSLYRMLLNTLKSAASILLIVASASIITWLILSSGLPGKLAVAIFTITTNKVVILLLINAVLLFLGCFLEGTSLITIMVPVLLPIVKALNVDLIHFGVFLVLNVMIGLITPPVGLCLYIACDIAKSSFADTVRAGIPSLIVLFIVLIIITFVPEFVTGLPNLLMGKSLV
jgi:tripartite ATP-independent transporter DctM subunit